MSASRRTTLFAVCSRCTNIEGCVGCAQECIGAWIYAGTSSGCATRVNSGGTQCPVFKLKVTAASPCIGRLLCWLLMWSCSTVHCANCVLATAVNTPCQSSTWIRHMKMYTVYAGLNPHGQGQPTVVVFWPERLNWMNVAGALHLADLCICWSPTWLKLCCSHGCLQQL